MDREPQSTTEHERWYLRSANHHTVRQRLVPECGLPSLSFHHDLIPSRRWPHKHDLRCALFFGRVGKGNCLSAAVTCAKYKECQRRRSAWELAVRGSQVRRHAPHPTMTQPWTGPTRSGFYQRGGLPIQPVYMYLALLQLVLLKSTISVFRGDSRLDRPVAGSATGWPLVSGLYLACISHVSVNYLATRRRMSPQAVS